MIFVSVAAFCEPFLEHTLQDAVAKARWPERLVFGVIDQTLEPRRAALAALCQPAKLRYLHIHPVESRGVCWARALAFSLYQNEDHLLQIDSHMLFEPGWDEQLLQQWQALLAQSAQPIVSTYPYGFEFEDGKPVVKINVSGKTTLVLRPHPDTDLSDTSATLRFRAEHVFTREPVRGCHVAGGFLFTAGRFVDEVPYDPHLYFHGEEQSLAVRAYTKGWDIFHPPHIPLFHLYKMPNMAHSTHHWHAEWEQQRDFKYPELTRHAKERLMDLLYERRDLGAYGLGKERSLADYARLSGVNYAKRQLVRPYQAEGYAIALPEPTLVPIVAASLSQTAPVSTTGSRVGACLPTHGRPDFVRAALLQLAAQSRVPDVVAVFQNGDAHSYEHLVRDVAWPFELQWLYTSEKVKQHEWYRQPLQCLLDAGCDVFLWTDHDDIYHSHHVATCEKELADCDFRVAKYANILYVDRTQYVLRERVRFTSHAPGGMSASMAFNRAFAQALVQDLAQDTEHYYSDNVVAKVTMPKFKCHASDELSTTYVSHKGSHTSSSWVEKVLAQHAENVPTASAT